MSQHDHQADATPQTAEHNEGRPEDVTYEQNGQFSMESDSVSGSIDDPLEARENASIVDTDAGKVTALQVTMDRSGAEYVDAQKAFLTNSGAKTIEGESSKLTNSGVLQLTTKTATLHQSSAVMVASDEVQVESGSIAFGLINKATLGDGVNVGALIAGEVEAERDINAFVLIGGEVHAGGSVTTTVDSSSAAVFGAIFGVVFALVWKMIRRS